MMSKSRDPDRDRRRRADSGTDAALPAFPRTEAIEQLLASGHSIDGLRREYHDLRDRYERGRRTPRMLGPEAVAAYAVARLPATMAVSLRALGVVAEALDRWEPRSLIDVGSGLGSSAWAAVAVFPTCADLTLVEDAPAMVAAAQAIAASWGHPPLRDARWASTAAGAPTATADLVVASYVLGEVGDPDAAVAEWWRATTGAILVIEPGTPAGYERILRARAQLVGAGANIVAPCPHAAACPLPAQGGGGWCHFAVRVGRSPLHRTIKGGTLSSEDEKFSYVAATRLALEDGPRQPRIIREPSRHGGHVRLELCTDTGIRADTVSKRHPDYQRIRKLRWGDSLPPPATDPIGSSTSPDLPPLAPSGS